MKHFKNACYIVPVFLIFTILVSCQKSAPTSEPNFTTPLLKRVVTIEGTNAKSYEEFEYNSNNLVRFRRDSTISNFTTPASILVFSSYFFYNSNDDKPVKDSTITKTSGGTFYKTITFYTYDGQSRLTKAESFINGNLVHRKLYTYASGKRMESYSRTNGVSTIYLNDTLYVNAQDQISEMVSHATGAINYKDRYAYYYDNQKNPYSNLNIVKYATRGTDSAYEYRSAYLLGANNVVKDSSFYLNGSAYELSISNNKVYTYNSGGYPSSCEVLKKNYTTGMVFQTTVNVSYEYY